MVAFSNLVDVTTPIARADGTFALEVADSWQQGRGAFGGLVLGALTRAAIASEPEKERTLRSVSAEITAPVVLGEASITVAVQRRGSGVTTLEAELHQGGETCAHATFVFGKARAGMRSWQPARIELPDFEKVAIAPIEPPLGPVFAQHFEFRLTGATPFSGATKPESEGFVRPKIAPKEIGPAELVAIADCFWPTGLVTETGFRPIATIASTTQIFLPEAPLDPEAPLFHRAFIAGGHEGYVVDFRALYSSKGELVALNQQTFVWIR